MKNKRKSCDYKIRYQDKIDADVALRQYLKQVVFTTMVPYRCKTHDCYHLGHDRFMSKSKKLKLKEACRDRVQYAFY